MAFLQCSLDALYRSTRAFLQGSFDIPWRGFWKNCGMCRCFFAVFFRYFVQGSNRAFLQGSLDIPSRGAW